MTETARPAAAQEPHFTGQVNGHIRARVTTTPGTIASLGYLTPQDQFGDVERGNPLPYTLPPERQREVGLERETWRLEVVADPESDTRLEHPLSNEQGTAIDFAQLLKLGETHGVRYLKAITCNNIGEPLGVGVWEGVPLRVLVWMAKPTDNVRRVFFYGYHNDDPEQRFQSSLPIGRVLEEPPGELPVLVCYKLNGEFLTGARGGPVRMVVPEAYGFKSVKWLQRVVLTNQFGANDTYAQWNNDVDSAMKTFARFSDAPSPVKAGQPITVSGLAQVGISGLEKVQIALTPQSRPVPEDDPSYPTLDWRDAEILPPPEDWGGGLPGGKLPEMPLQFDPRTGKPREWPLRYTIAHWRATLRDVPPGAYTLRCRSIDRNGFAQPMPRPFPKSGRAAIQDAPLIVQE